MLATAGDMARIQALAPGESTTLEVGGPEKAYEVRRARVGYVLRTSEGTARRFDTATEAAWWLRLDAAYGVGTWRSRSDSYLAWLACDAGAALVADEGLDPADLCTFLNVLDMADRYAATGALPDERGGMRNERLECEETSNEQE